MSGRRGLFAKLYVDYPNNPKILRLSDAAFRAHVTMIAYARQYMTDGVIGEAFASQFASQVLDELCTNDDENPSLVRLGNGDFLLHGYVDSQETKAEIERKSQVRADAGRKGGEANASRFASRLSSNGRSKNKAEKEKEREIVVSSPNGLLTAAPPSPPKPEPKSARSPRPPDPLFDTVAEVCGIDPKTLTATGRGAINASLKQLRDVHATPEQVRARGSTYRQRFPGAALTAPALAKHWASLGANHPGDPWSPPPGSPLSYVEL